LGIDYIKSDNFSIFSSPFAMKLTIVNDQTLANAGSFGVTGATFDGVGNILKQGERLRGEFGAYVKMKYNFVIAKNIDLKSKLELFSNYLNNPQNIDVNAEALFNFKVNETSIEVYDNKGRALGFCPFITEIEKKRFPNILQAIPPESALQEINYISVNPELLNQVYEANNRDVIRMQFIGEAKAVRITFLNSEAVGVVMPLRFEK
jgi:hypothetical protein